jgi:hypothetical protein
VATSICGKPARYTHTNEIKYNMNQSITAATLDYPRRTRSLDAEA